MLSTALSARVPYAICNDPVDHCCLFGGRRRDIVSCYIAHVIAAYRTFAVDGVMNDANGVTHQFIQDCESYDGHVPVEHIIQNK